MTGRKSKSKPPAAPDEHAAPTRVVTLTVPAMLVENKKGATVPKIIGYYTKGKTPNWTRMKEYHAWKDHVREHVPPELLGRYGVSLEARVVINVRAFFASGVHPDVENVRKGVVDAICTNGDRWVAGSHAFPAYDPVRPRIEVEVQLFDPALGPEAA